jgi:sugar fermentation stimulation protein A
LNRFVVEVRYRGRKKLAHINNTGRLHELIVKGGVAACLSSHGKTDYRLFAVKESEGWALIDTQLQMRAFEKAVEAGSIPWLRQWHLVRRNPRLGESVLDYLFTDERGTVDFYLEAKSAVLRKATYAMYPDCPTLRGQRHIRTLSEYALQGGKAAVCFIAALEGVSAFRPNIDGDPVVASLLKEAFRAQVEIRAISLCFEEQGIRLSKPDLPVMIP